MRKYDCDDDNYDDETIMTPGWLKEGYSHVTGSDLTKNVPDKSKIYIYKKIKK